MKNKGYFKYFRESFFRERELLDSEYRLLNVYRNECDWESRHKHFGTAEIATLEIKADYLPGWSTGKISEVRKGLVVKGLLERVTRSRFAVQMPEPAIQSAERKVRVAERTARLVEQKRDLLQRLSMQNTTQNIQPTERTVIPKETLEKEKENINKGNSSFKEEEGWYGEGITERVKRLQEIARRRNSQNGP